MKFGVDILLDRRSGRSNKGALGLVTNDGARTATGGGVLSRKALVEAGFSIKRLFSPEHGIAAAAADGAPVTDGTDSVTGLQIRSLYGQGVKPSGADLEDLTAVLFDLPDAGYRFYTYIWTLFLMMKACEEAGRHLMVLDRPNPVGGEMETVEGPLLDVDRYRSFVGMDRLPVRHSLTVGELAALWHKEKFPRLALEIVPMEGWKRSWHWPDTGVAFTPPSPAIHSYETTLVYGALCFLEGTNVSVGRGTNHPFLQFGAPWIESKELLGYLEKRLAQAVTLERVTFTPSVEPNLGISCEGIRLHPVQSRKLRPVETGFQVIVALLTCYPETFAWTPYQTAANPGGRGHFDRLAGQGKIRERLETAASAIDLDEIRTWTTAPGWAEMVEPHLLYS